MYKLRNIDIEHSQKIYKKLNKFISRLKEKFPVKEVYLYGSFANKEFHEGSDIDLVIVGDFKGKIFERIEKVLKLTDLPIEPLVYTPEEFYQMKKSNYFLKKIMKNSKRLYTVK